MNIQSPSLQLSRRALLTAAAAAGGGLLIGFPLRQPARAQAPAKLPVPNAFIRIGPDNKVTFLVPYVEMGQGAYTAQMQILAEELEVDPSTVTVEPAPPDEPLYANPLLGGQITGGSASLRGAWITLRTAGACARLMLVEAAARQWGVAVESCTAANGTVTHAASGRTLSYGALATAAAQLPVPQSPALKKPGSFKVVGKPTPRVDTPAKVTGEAKFGIDARVPGMRYAFVSACPVFGGTLASIDDSAALKVPGVQQVVRIEDALAVVARNSWAARTGLAALRVTWNDGPNANLDTAALIAELDAGLDRQGLIATNTGDTAAAEAGAASRYQADFRQPILAHAALEPLSCTVHVRDGGCEIWLGSQVLGRAQKAAADALGVPLDKVVAHNHLLGGGFGRRLETDYVSQAVKLAKNVEGPVKITWTREEDMRHDYYRYLNNSRVTVGLDAKGQPVSWRHRVVGPNIMSRFLPIYQKDGVDLDIVGSAHGPYDIPNVFIEYVRQEAPNGLNTGNWRGVGATRNVYIVESVMDELAARAGRDPVEYRLGLMQGAPRVRAALEIAARMAQWGRKLPERTAMGVATFTDFGSYLAVIAQVRVANSGHVTVEHVWCAVDTGIPINPDIIRAQIEGGIVFGLTAALQGRITVAKGRVVEGNFDTYPVMRMRESPPIEVHIIESEADPGGVGEPGTSGAIAAVANAVAAATGRRAFTLPLDPNQLRQA
ncbi:MAG: aldehyde dehydrogenase [Xanthobacteraceae bacterium]|jgi:isoquinoline 1-oxidoreductase beta subunit|nr:aldehyde dehydrogenase [Xanthobacteraceae bacterium]